MTQTNSTNVTDLSQRTPEEIFTHHAQALGAEDLDATVLDYVDDAVLITPDRVLRGKEGARQFFAGLFQAVPQALWGLRTTYVDNLLFLLWTADSTSASISNGVDTFIFKDGLIQYQTIYCTIRER
jgi:SnoaL-like domain